MSETFDNKMEDIFQLEKKVLPTTISDIMVPKISEPIEVVINKEDADKDYTTVRANLKEIVNRGTEAIDGIMVVATESQSPRAYEVVATLIKCVADANMALMDLHRKIKEINKMDVDNSTNTTNVTNNSLFVGSTAELQKLIKGKIKEIDETRFIDEKA